MLGTTWPGTAVGGRQWALPFYVSGREGKMKAHGDKVHEYQQVIPGGELVRKQAGAEKAAQS
jgi:hypothetical protein